ncbi:helix-turn-helix domain-containing protein [Chryseolinea lacunae]|uniref:Helix-turn-helix transcriptional regulator n=1 Tax=Chryseolinea lacunae TaxID=2801331 RepID=A0ABS1KMQ6_9BACT|nr:helix-turn-helix domain-containing protein [Chryseolinea lacunae]MBL0740739.1 helix-turn-helix transcriptional regulator [Chryseolinea lacunae]
MKEKDFLKKETKPHQGRNVKRFRDMWDMKQETLASMLGADWNQKKVSHLEAMEEIDADLLEPLAKALKVTPEAIKQFDEEKIFAIISNTFNDNSGVINNIYSSFKSNEELLGTIKKLYEQLLSEKDERIALLQKRLNLLESHQ